MRMVVCVALNALICFSAAIAEEHRVRAVNSKENFFLDTLYKCAMFRLYTCKRRKAMATAKLPPVSPGETEILRLVWQLKKATVQQVRDRLPKRRKIAYATVQTLLRRLEKKGYVKHETQGKAHVFFPAVRKEEVIRKSVSDFLERLFGGDPVPLVQYLAEHGKIDAADIEKLRKLIEK